MIASYKIVTTASVLSQPNDYIVCLPQYSNRVALCIPCDLLVELVLSEIEVSLTHSLTYHLVY